MDRRRGSTRSDELRRRLREADRELYERIRAIDPITSVTVTVARLDDEPMLLLNEDSSDVAAAAGATLLAFPEPHQAAGISPRRWMATIAAAALLSFAAGHAFVTWTRWSHPPATRTETIADRSPSSPLTSSTLGRLSSQRAASSAADTSLRGEARAVPPATAAGRTPSRAQASAPRVSLARAVDRSAGPAFSPSFASNGTLFFHTGRSADARSDIASADLGGDVRVMSIGEDGARNYHVQPSPDDTRVAFDSDRDGERGVYVANRDGSGVKRVSGAGYAAVPTWSPGGDRLAFVRAEGDRPHVWNLWLLTLATGEMQRLTSFKYGQTWGASWFGDGRRIAYTHEDRLAVLDLASGATRLFPSPIAGRLVRTPAVSPDGRHVIFQVSRSGAWLLDLSDGSTRCVLNDPTAEEFAWSPDGRRVAFHSRRDGQWGIWLMASASS
jgi:hypothetical protein